MRSSNLETGLSSSVKTITQEMDIALSLLLTFQAWKEKHGYLRKDYEKTRDRIVDKYQFPLLALISFPKEVCFYESYFQYGLHFPAHPLYREVLSRLKISPG